MYGILVIFVLLLANNFSNASNSEATSQVKCRAGNSSGPAEMPKMTEIIGDTTVMVCGSESEEKSSEGRVFSEFSIKSANTAGVVTENIKKVGALDDYMISKQGEALQLDEVVLTKKGWWPVFRSSVTCKASKCSLSKEKCIFKLLPSADKWFWEELVPYFEGNKVGQVPDESLIIGAFHVSLTGDKKAVQFFSKRPSKLKSDGASSEEYNRASAMIARLKKADCLK